MTTYDQLLNHLLTEHSHQADLLDGADYRTLAELHSDDHLTSDRHASEIIRVVWVTADIEDIAEEHDVPFEVAMARATEWAKGITDTVTTIAGEQLVDAVTLGQP